MGRTHTGSADPCQHLVPQAFQLLPGCWIRHGVPLLSLCAFLGPGFLRVSAASSSPEINCESPLSAETLPGPRSFMDMLLSPHGFWRRGTEETRGRRSEEAPPHHPGSPPGLPCPLSTGARKCSPGSTRHTSPPTWLTRGGICSAQKCHWGLNKRPAVPW